MDVRKYFIAIVIPEPHGKALEDIKNGLYQHYGLKGALRSPAHITLHRPFEWKVKKEGDLIQKLHEFRYTKSFEIHLQNFGYFEPRVIYADVKPEPHLNELHKTLSRFVKLHLHLFNETEDKRGFHPHVTLAFRDLKKPLFYALASEFKTKTFQGCFNYGGFTLLKLEKKWEILETFPNKS